MPRPPFTPEPSARALGALIIVVGGTALGAGTEPASPAASAAGASLATLLRLALALAAVLLAFWGCARLMRRLNGVGTAATAGGDLRLVGALSLGQRERLVLVQAGEERLLLGVSANRIERLHRLEGSPAASLGANASPSARPHGSHPSSSPAPARPCASSPVPRTSPDPDGGAPGTDASGADDFRARLLAALRERTPS